MISVTTFALMAVGQFALPGYRMEARQAYAEAHAVAVAEITWGGVVGTAGHWAMGGIGMRASTVLKGDAADVNLEPGLTPGGGGTRRAA